MHPIERLRFVARSQGAPPELLVEESAIALGAFRDDPAGLVAACRRIIDRQPTCAPLWWLCARILCSPDPMSEARSVVQELDADTSAHHLADALPRDATVVVLGAHAALVAALARRGDVRTLVVDLDDGPDLVRHLAAVGVDAEDIAVRALAVALDRSAVVLVEALAVGPDAALVPSGGRVAAAVAGHAEVPVWLVAGVGRLLPGRMWGALLSRWSASVDPFDASEEELPLSLVGRIAGPEGPEEVADALRRTDCPVAPELFRRAG